MSKFKPRHACRMQTDVFDSRSDSKQQLCPCSVHHTYFLQSRNPTVFITTDSETLPFVDLGEYTTNQQCSPKVDKMFKLTFGSRPEKESCCVKLKALILSEFRQGNAISQSKYASCLKLNFQGNHGAVCLQYRR